MLSVVLPIYNEVEVLDRALEAITATLVGTGKSFEIVCVNDGSTDGSAERLSAVSKSFPEARCIHLSRNFGKDAALSAGLDAARGQAVIVMDADLQHPPALLPELVGAWEEGYQVVSGIKSSRGEESLSYRLMARAFNTLMGGAAGVNFQGASDFKLLDRQAVDAIANLPEKTRFFRGLVTWVGFRTKEVPFEVAERVAGTSKWGTRALVRYSLRNLLAFSAFPLRLVALAGVLTLVLSGLLAVWTLYRWARGDALTGFTTVILLQLFIGGLLLSGVGVIAVYLGAIYEEIKSRPTYVVNRRDREP